MVDKLTRHELLKELHAVFRPDVYLETGVQHGWSLELARAARVAVGIDPMPLIPASGNMDLQRGTSDAYFAECPDSRTPHGLIDFAFVDGMHLAEFALRDFMNVEKRGHAGTVVVFDDVLPRNQVEANRVQCPGDWTGDVWKVYYILRKERPDLELTLLDTAPTGTLVVRGIDTSSRVLDLRYEGIERWEAKDRDVPVEVLERTHAQDAREWLNALKGAML